MDKKQNLLYKDPAQQRYWKRLECQIKTYKRQDPPPQPKLAVPVAVAHWASKYARSTPTIKQEAVGDLTTIAFYYLLCVGECTYTSRKLRPRTQQFRVCDVTLWHHQTPIPNTAPLSQLLTATSATMKISNQKNGTRGQLVHHTSTGNSTDPVRSLAYRISHIMTHTNDIHTPLSARVLWRHQHIRQEHYLLAGT